MCLIFGYNQSARRQAHRLCAGSRAAPRALPTRPADVRRDVCRRQTIWQSYRLPNHVLHALIPPQFSASQRYNLRHRTHSYSCHHTPNVCQTQISPHECCTKTNIRHLLNFWIIVCVLLIVHCCPAFWHAANKRLIDSAYVSHTVSVRIGLKTLMLKNSNRDYGR